MKFIPYGFQTIDRSDIRAVSKSLSSNFITQGPLSSKFEKNISSYVGSLYSVVFSSGTAALEAAYFAAGIKKGDEVITSPISFTSTAYAAIWQGANVVFADVNEKGIVSLKNIEALITKKTKAIVPVDYAGNPADISRLKKIAKQNGIVLIEDAAQALGAKIGNKMIGSFADMTIFSFHPVKTITAGEGGAVTTNNKLFYEKLLMFRNHGIVKDVNRFITKNDNAWYYEQQTLGHNYRLTDFQAALGISQLKKINVFLKKRQRIADSYIRELGTIKDLEIVKPGPGLTSSWHLFVVRLIGNLAPHRDEIFKALRGKNIGVQVHHIPIYLHPYWRKLGYKKGLCPNAEIFFNAIISLPIYPNLVKTDQVRVISELQKIIFKYEKSI